MKRFSLQNLRKFPETNRIGTATLLPVILITCHIFGSGRTLASKDACFAQQDPSAGNVQTLAPGEVVPRHINPGDTHPYELTLAAQQFARIVVEQKGVDLTVKVEAPDGSFYREIDNPNGLYGPEIVSILAPVLATYRIKVCAENKTLPAGSYELRVEGPRDATEVDEVRVDAERIFAEAQQLRREARAASEKYNLAIKKYDDSLLLWRQIADLRGQGYSLTNAARAYKALGKPEPALDYLAQARSLLHEAEDAAGEAFTLNEIGGVHRDFDDTRNALPSYDSAIKIRLSLGDRYGLAQLYNNIALAYSNIGYQPQAAQSLEKAQQLWRELGIRSEEMNSLVTAAKARAEMGDLEIALSQYQTALTYCDSELRNENSFLKQSATHLKPYALSGIGLVSDTWADTDTARVNYQQALELFRANKYRREEADVLDNLGILYAFLGDARQALDYLQQALVLREQLNQPKGWGVTLSNLGLVYMLLEENDEANKRLTLSLEHSRGSGDRRFEAYSLVRLGMVHIAQNEPRKALEYYERALAIQQEPLFADQRGQAITLDKIAEALKLSGEESQALKKYDEAVERWKAVGDKQGQALSLYGIAQIERDRLNLANARDRAEEAIRIVEKLRNRVSGRQLQMIYFAGRHDLYALAIDVRMKLYESNQSRADLEAAVSISEQARARNLLDSLSEARIAPNRSMSQLKAEKYTRLQREIDELTQTSLRYRSTGLKESATIVEQMLTDRMREQDRLLLSARRANARLSFEAPQAQPLTPREIQQLLDDDTMLLQYSLDEKRSHLWTITRTEIQYHPLRGRSEIEETANHLRQALTGLEPQRSGESNSQYLTRRRETPEQYRRSALELSRMVLDPVSSQLGNRRLIIVADGALQYIPFEVLRLAQPITSVESASSSAGPATVLLRNEVVYLPSASTLSLVRRIRRPSTTKTVAVIADPVFDETDDRLRLGSRRQEMSTSRLEPKQKLARSLRDIGDTGNGAFALTKLEYSLREANAITAIAPRGSWMKAVGFKASRAAVMSPNLKQFNIVHFATHGILNDRIPELSGIVLSMLNERGQAEDGFLTLRDIYNLDLPVRLVVLSACHTGVGKSVRGEGLIGLTRGFLNAGAQSLVVSLWQVDDRATAELMERFYRHMLGKNRLSAAAALREAKLEMKQENYEPYFWAGFVLQGDWK
jgi:CHAT domain-containing protein